MIVLIGGEKGGTGKSTLTTNLCVCLSTVGHDVVLLDADRQGTSANWASERASQDQLSAVHCVQRYGQLIGTIKDLASRYEQVIIDAGGRDSEELRSAMTLADKFYSPLRPSQSDLWTVEHVDHLVGLAQGFNPKLEAYLLLSMTPTNPRVNESEGASVLLETFTHLTIATAQIRERKAYRDALRDGRGVIELNDAKALTEIENLMEEIYGKTVQSQARKCG